MLSALDQSRIEAAVNKAEEGTTGEIVCVLSGEVSHYPEVALGLAAIVSLVLPALALALGMRPLALAADSEIWMAAQAGALEGELALALGIYAIIQTVLFVVTFLILEIPAVRRVVTPSILKRHKVERAAKQQFAAIAARARGSETGVLLFVALVDRQVQVLVDRSLHDKADEAAWKAAAAAIARGMKEGKYPTNGIVQAVEICGSVLRAHFPSSEPREQVFSNHPVEI